MFSLWFAAFSIIAALVTRDHESTISVLPEWMQVLAAYNPVAYGVDAVRALMLGQDVLTVVGVAAFSGIWNTVVPAVAVLGVLGLVLSGLATVSLYRVSSSRVS